MAELFDLPDRRELDRYYTPDPVALHLAALVPARPEWAVADLQVGGGAWIRAVRQLGHTGPVVVADIDENARGLSLATGPLDRSYRYQNPGIYVDLIVGNPPYNQAEECVEQALKRSPRVAYLLRLSFLGSAGRVPFFERHPPSIAYMVSPRPSFTGGGADMSEYAFIVWDKTYSGPTRLAWTQIGRRGSALAWSHG